MECLNCTFKDGRLIEHPYYKEKYLCQNCHDEIFSFKENDISYTFNHTGHMIQYQGANVGGAELVTNFPLRVL